MSKDVYTFTESLKSEIILAVIIFFPLLFTITGIILIYFITSSL